MPLIVESQLQYSMETSDFSSVIDDDGFSPGLVRCIIQDKKGFIWFATKDGLNKYDGYHITTYQYDPDNRYSLPDNTIFTLLEDERENFWVGTATQGICLFDRKTERFYKVSGKLEGAPPINDAVLNLAVKNGKLLANQLSNLFVWDISNISPEKYTEVQLQSLRNIFNFNKSYFKEFNEDFHPFLMPNDELWVGYYDSIIIFKPNRDFTKWQTSYTPYSNFEGSGKISCILSDIIDKNKVYLINNSHILLYDINQKKTVRSFCYAQNGNKNITAVQDPSGNIWIENERNEFYKFQYASGEIRTYHPGSANDVDVLEHFVLQCADRSGIIWFGSNGYGMLKYDPNVEYFHKILIGPVESFWEDESGNIITKKFQVITKNGDILGGLIPAHQLNKYKISENPFSARDNNGKYWIAGNKNDELCLLSFEPQSKKIEEFKDFGINNKSFCAMFFDYNNFLWIGVTDTNHSRILYKFDINAPKLIATFPCPLINDFNRENFIMDWYQDAQGIFWFGTHNGLIRFNEKKMEWFTYKNQPGNLNSISNNVIFSICPDPLNPQSYLWLGTNGGGINKFEFKTGNCVRYTKKDGLPNNVVYTILTDADLNLWMSTNNGLSCFSPEIQKFRNFTQRDGILGNEFKRFAAHQSKNGDLFFGGPKGITWFKPEEVLRKHTAPNLVFTGFSFSWAPGRISCDTTELPAPIGYLNSITLPHDKNMFQISFAALDYSLYDNKIYKYYLEGYDDDWINAGKINTASYINLKPGQYVFHVISSGPEGKGQDNEIMLDIHIMAPWYATWWFISFASLVLFLFAYAAVMYRITQIKKLKLIRNKIAADLHDEIGSALSSIGIYSNILQDQEANIQLKSIARRIYESARTTLESINDIVWSVNPNNDSFDTLIMRMRAQSFELLEAMDCNLDFNAEDELSEIKLSIVSQRNFYLIFKESLNNTVKYANAKNVVINIYLKDKCIHYKIKDDGSGFDIENHKGGNGLLNMEKRAFELKGKLKVVSQNGDGTELYLVFPL